MNDTGHFLDETKPDPRALWPIPAVYLLHGKGGSPNGTVKKLQGVLQPHSPGLVFIRPALPHSDPAVASETAVEHLLKMQIPRHSLLLGISLGGLVAAKLQEVGRQDLQVMAISSPTWADGVALERQAEQRLSFYSSSDEVIGARVTAWPQLASFSRDFDWLDHDTDQHLKHLARLFDWYLEGTLANRIGLIRTLATTKQETDEKVWELMANAKKVSTEWRDSPWDGGRPQTFAEIGEAMQSGANWRHAWSDWRHEFIGRKDSRCLAQEPPTSFPPERRAMIAGTAEFFARLYNLPKPTWVDKQQYFLPEPYVYGSAASEQVFGSSESEAEYYRARATTPKEMLRRNVVFAARNLTVL